MPYILIFLGIALGDLAWQGPSNVVQAGTLLRNEVFGGSDPFYKWLGALILLGLIGYIPQGRGLATSLLVLLLLAIILSKRSNAFSAFTTLIKKV